MDAVIGRNRGEVCIGAHNVQCKFRLGKECGPVVHWERWVSCSQYTKKVTAEGLDGAFGGVGTFVVGGD
jgi:hypothetical protein